MKAILEFDLLEEEEEFQQAVNARKYYCALWDIKQFIRGELKHGLTMDAEELLEHIRNMIPSEDF